MNVRLQISVSPLSPNIGGELTSRVGLVMVSTGSHRAASEDVGHIHAIKWMVDGRH